VVCVYTCWQWTPVDIFSEEISVHSRADSNVVRFRQNKLCTSVFVPEHAVDGDITFSVFISHGRHSHYSHHGGVAPVVIESRVGIYLDERPNAVVEPTTVVCCTTTTQPPNKNVSIPCVQRKANGLNLSRHGSINQVGTKRSPTPVGVSLLTAFELNLAGRKMFENRICFMTSPNLNVQRNA